ncbi:MAG TPA: hypothetical protein VFV95_13785 [Vicinamibacterales bacterium]|nr:hypothetical protein [Vicinamibacterales bacterium]
MQAVVDGEAGEAARAHLAGCDRCRSRVGDRRKMMTGVTNIVESEGALPAGLEFRVRESIRANRPVRGATVLRGPESRPAWKRPVVLSALATAAGVAFVVAVLLPRMGAPTSLSAAEILGRSLQTLSAATGVERVEYELTLSGAPERRVVHLIDHQTPSRYRLMSYASDGALHLAVAQDPATGVRSHLFRVDGRNYIVNVGTLQPLASLPQMAQAQLEALIGMMQATSDPTLTVVEEADGRKYVVESPPVVPKGSAAVLDVYSARAVIDGRDFRVREFKASGALLKQPYDVTFRLIRQEQVAPETLDAAAFTIQPGPDDVVLDGNVTDTPFTDVLDVVLKEVGRLRAGH